MIQEKGFNLIELLITVAIIGILSAIAYPNYQEYVIQSRRSEGIAMLLHVMQQQERFFTEQITYTTDLTTLGFTLTAGAVASENDYYRIIAAACGALSLNRCVLLTATPQGVQEDDGNLTLNSQGVRTPANYW